MRLCKTGRSILAGVIACILAVALIMIQRDDDVVVFHAPDGSSIPFNKREFVAAFRPTVNAPAGANAQIDAANGKTYYVQESLQQVIQQINK